MVPTTLPQDYTCPWKAQRYLDHQPCARALSTRTMVLHLRVNLAFIYLPVSLPCLFCVSCQLWRYCLQQLSYFCFVLRQALTLKPMELTMWPTCFSLPIAGIVGMRHRAMFRSCSSLQIHYFIYLYLQLRNLYTKLIRMWNSVRSKSADS